MTTQQAKAERREAKLRCLERLADARAKSKAEHEHREYATQVVARMRAAQHRMAFPTRGLNRTLFERLLQSALERHFEISEQQLFTTDEIIALVNEVNIHLNDQREILRLMSIDGDLGCTYAGENFWHFPWIERATIPTSTSIFDK